MDKVAIIVAAAFLAEAIVQVLKTWVPTVSTQKVKLAWWEIISSLVGVGMAWVMGVNLIDLVLETSGVAWYAGMVASGVIIGRGASFVHDLINKIRGDATK